MAVLKCGKCGFEKKLPDKYADRKVRCPDCGEASTVQADAEDLGLEDVIDQTADTGPVPASGTIITEDELTEAMQAGQRRSLIEGSAVKNVFGGLFAGVQGVFFAIAVAVLLFSQAPVSGHLSHALSIALMSATIIGLFVALKSRITFAAAGPESMAGLILLLVVGHVHAIMQGSPPENIYPTILATVAVCALFAGIFLLATGLTGSSDFIRYIPIQAVGGMLAAVGFMVFLEAVGIALGEGGCINDIFTRLAGGELCLRWTPAVGLGFVLFIFMRWFRNAYAIVLLLAAAIGGLYGYLHWQGIGLEEAWKQNWLFPRFERDVYWEQIYTLDFIQRIDWWTVLDNAGHIAALGGLMVASLMIRVTELEIFIGRPIDLDAEFRTLGLGNIISGLAGGMPGTLAYDRSLCSRSAGANGILSGLLAVVVCAVAFVFSSEIMPYVPRFVPAGILVAMGLLLMWRWLVDARTRFSHKGDYGLLVLIFLITSSFGLLVGLGIGAGLAMIVTAVRYGSVSVVKLEMSGASFRSNVDRAPSQLSVLKTKGDQIYALTLQGFIFLGTTNRLIELVVDRVSEPGREPLRFALLDFTFTSGLDSSVAISFIKLKQIARASGFTLVFTNVPFELEEQMGKAGCVLNDQDGGSITVTSLDYALEWAEDHILDDMDELHQEQKSLPDLLAPVFPDPQFIPVLMKVLRRVQVKEGKPVFRQGDPSDAMYFIERGMVNVELELEGGKRLRLKKMGPGTVFGEMGLYTSSPRTASIIAAEDCVLYRLPTKVMSLLQNKRPALASAIHRFIVSLLADRVGSANATIRDIMR